MGAANQHIVHHQTQDFRIQDSIWFQVPRPVVNPRMRLFCFSYAGGNASAYREWNRKLPNDVEVCAVQLPGRGARFKEQPFKSLDGLVTALVEAIEPFLDVPFAFFGHSMGSQVGYEVSNRLRKHQLPLPQALFVSGRRAPNLPAKRRPIHDLPEVEFREEIRRLNGTPAEAFNNPELMDLVSPILRADCQVIETHKYCSNEPLALPIYAFGGAQDASVSIEDLENWAKLTSDKFEIRLFSGDHFYIHFSIDALMECLSHFINKTLVPEDNVGSRYFPRIAAGYNR